MILMQRNLLVITELVWTERCCFIEIRKLLKAHLRDTFAKSKNIFSSVFPLWTKRGKIDVIFLCLELGNSIVKVPMPPPKACTLPVRKWKWCGMVLCTGSRGSWGGEGRGGEVIWIRCHCVMFPIPWTRSKKHISHSSRLTSAFRLILFTPHFFFFDEDSVCFLCTYF